MLDRLVNWAETNQALLWWVGSASALALVVTLIAVIVIVIRMPPDYFADRGHHRMTLFRSHPALALAVSIARNTLGVVFLAAGLAMLVLPGQGLLTIFVALVLLQFPCKLRLERWLVAKPAVRRPLDGIRRKAGRPPLVVETGPDDA